MWLLGLPAQPVPREIPEGAADVCRGEYTDFGAHGSNFRLVVDVKPYLDIEPGTLAEQTLQDVAESAREEEELAELQRSMDSSTEGEDNGGKKDRPAKEIDDLASYIDRVTHDS